jgi:putative transposase
MWKSLASLMRIVSLKLMAAHSQAPQARHYVAQRVSAGKGSFMMVSPGAGPPARASRDGVEKGRHMSHSFSKNHVHVVFSTKDRRRTISETMQPEMWSYLAGICRNEKMVSVAVGGIADHVHLLFHLPPTVSLAKAISVLKSNSSRWMNERGIKFAWQEGYGAFSVSASNLTTVSRYIRDQKTHHRKFSFEDEFLTLLRKHKVDFDLQSVFG